MEFVFLSSSVKSEFLLCFREREREGEKRVFVTGFLSCQDYNYHLFDSYSLMLRAYTATGTLPIFI